MFHLALPFLYDFGSVKGKMESSSYEFLAFYASCIGTLCTKALFVWQGPQFRARCLSSMYWPMPLKKE